ncbi:MAG: sensor histidine kinase [Nitrospirota bacterium]|nr:sensor histidine kinase [Nitrospirota bacterium]MDE3220892.1 sensor histidine kinase [Nitrospirota bacterium]
MERTITEHIGREADRSHLMSLTTLSLVDVARLIARVRHLASHSSTIESFAQQLMQSFQETFRTSPAGDPEMVLSRCFVAQPFTEVASDVKTWLQVGQRRTPEPSAALCLSLMGSAGVVEGWNDASRSSRYRAIPVEADRFATRFPMFAEVFRQVGISIDKPRLGEGMTIGSAGTGCNVFHVPVALGSPYVPAQEEFVKPFGVRSVVGFGGWYGQGLYFLVILFSKVAILPRSVELLRLLALSVRVGFNTVSGIIAKQATSGCPGFNHIQTLDELLTLYEETVDVQSDLVVHQRDQLRALAERVMTAQEDERRRVAGELHDHVVSQLAAILFGVRSLIQVAPMTREEMMKALGRVADELEEATTSARELSLHLHPMMLDRVGLSSALQKFLEDVTRRTGLRIARTIEDVHYPLLPMAAAALYRVAEEAIHNVRQHAAVDEAQLYLSVVDATVVLRVRDEGRGFDVHHQPGTAGLGLCSMAERIRHVGGQLRVESRPGVGTEIEVRIPCATSEGMVGDGDRRTL